MGLLWNLASVHLSCFNKAELIFFFPVKHVSSTTSNLTADRVIVEKKKTTLSSKSALKCVWSVYPLSPPLSSLYHHKTHVITTRETTVIYLSYSLSSFSLAACFPSEGPSFEAMFLYFYFFIFTNKSLLCHFCLHIQTHRNNTTFVFMIPGGERAWKQHLSKIWWFGVAPRFKAI